MRSQTQSLHPYDHGLAYDDFGENRMNNLLNVKAAGSTRWDCVSLGEVMLRLDPVDDRIHTSHAFRASERGGGYNAEQRR
jgi:hypothetical protein